MNRRLSVMAATTLLVAAAGCGGSDEPTGGKASEPREVASSAAPSALPLDTSQVSTEQPAALTDAVTVAIKPLGGEEQVVRVAPVSVEKLDAAAVTRGADPGITYYAITYTVTYVNGLVTFGLPGVAPQLRTERGIGGVPGIITAGQVEADGCEPADSSGQFGPGSTVTTCLISGMSGDGVPTVLRVAAGAVSSGGTGGDDFYWPLA